MARQVRFELAHARYLVTARGNRGEPVFRDDADRATFLDTLAECCARSRWHIEAYTLLNNHFHLVLFTDSPNLATGMKWFLGTYTRRFNLRAAVRGHVFEGRYRSLVVDSSQTDLACDLVDYVHLNPARLAPLAVPVPITTESELRSFPWCGYKYYAQTEPPPAWFRLLPPPPPLPSSSPAELPWVEHTTHLLDLMATSEGRSALDERWKPIRRGWCLGSPEFRTELLSQIGINTATGRRSSYGGAARAAHDTAQAKALLERGLSTLGLSLKSVVAMPKGAVEKQALAWLLRTRTVIGRTWIAEQLEMGDASRVTQACHLARSSPDSKLAALTAQLGTLEAADEDAAGSYASVLGRRKPSRKAQTPRARRDPDTSASESQHRESDPSHASRSEAPEAHEEPSHPSHSLAPDFLD